MTNKFVISLQGYSTPNSSYASLGVVPLTSLPNQMYEANEEEDDEEDDQELSGKLVNAILFIDNEFVDYYIIHCSLENIF